MTIRFGYYADLRTIQLDESGRGWIQAMRVGKYNHPKHGLLDFTIDRLHKLAEGVKSKVRGVDLDIDYDHKMDPTKGSEAAGWVKDAKVENNALWLLVEWTRTAAEKIKEKAYRYFSPEFQDVWTDAAGVEHKDVLFGGGITNRPFLKDLLPLNLSELTFADPPDREEGMTEEQKALRQSLGLPEDATDKQVLEAVSKLKVPNVDENNTAHGPNDPATPNGPRNDAPSDANRTDADANPFDDKKLSEMASSTNPETRMLADYIRQQNAQREEERKQLAELVRTNKENQVTIKLGEYSQGNRIIAPAVLEDAKKLLVAVPVQLHELVYNLLNKMRDDKSTVQLGETPGASSHGRNMPSDGKTAEQIVEERIAKKLSENKELGYADASSMVFAEDTGLFDRYQRESYIVARDAR